jgi:hypothetical protein
MVYLSLSKITSNILLSPPSELALITVYASPVGFAPRVLFAFGVDPFAKRLLVAVDVGDGVFVAIFWPRYSLL